MLALIAIFVAFLFLRGCRYAYTRLITHFSRLLLHFLCFVGHIYLHLELTDTNRDYLIPPFLKLSVLAGEGL